MTELLNRAFAKIGTLPEAEQDMFAAVLLAALEPGEVTALDEAARAAIREGVAQAERGEFASDEEIADLWRNNGR
jgi:predicted transcriptional regulator